MKNMSLMHIASACKGRYIGEEEKKSLIIQGVVTDSRQIERDFLFVPVVGERADGHDFIPAVFAQGALATLSERELCDCPGPYILVGSALQALKDIARYYRQQLHIPIVGITGSVGKTSTKEMVASVLSVRYRVLKTAGNFNNEIGLPLTLLRIREEHEAAVVEMGISDFGEMHRLGDIARPDVVVITNIGSAHLENLGNREGILKAKTEIFDHIKKGASVILNGDDNMLAEVRDAGGNAPIFYGVEGGGFTDYQSAAFWPQLYADQVENLGFRGSRARLHLSQALVALRETIRLEIPIPGQHMLYNALAAVGVGLALGLHMEEIQDGIAQAQTIAGRSHLLELGNMLVIDDSYNANPASVEAALELLKDGSEDHSRSIAVLGDMGELGEEEGRLHYEVGDYAAIQGIDALFLAGTLAKEMARGAREGGGKEVYYFPTKEEMLPALLSYLKDGDAILVKASHFMDFSSVVEEIKKKVS